MFFSNLLEASFAALLEQMGPANETPDGNPLPMKIEPWPGGRWYRDLGNDNGHHWGHVQAIKRPTLLEITGPLFMSHACEFNRSMQRFLRVYPPASDSRGSCGAAC